MLSYRHSFHAGCDADVCKHVALVAVLTALARKPAPFFVLDTHGGAGTYPLADFTDGRRAEWRDGVDRVWSTAAADDAPESVRRWHALVAEDNPDGVLAQYPGSPLITSRLLREHDRSHVTELHPRDAPRLDVLLGGDRRYTVREADGYTTMRATLPPQERRGLVFIDPAYEREDEPDRLFAAVRDNGLARFGHGTFLIWYPLGGKTDVERMAERLGRLPARKSFEIRYQRGQAHERARAGSGLAGCGLFLLNPPWQLDVELQAAFEWLAPRLYPDASAHLRWFVADSG